ncbi:hypothetical protein JL720_16779 [Aureococcus anophagefferens]|nr:hypothetical protein JL720_16779 [Aureococcus anophagefferens]
MNESQAEHLANVFCTTPFSPGEQIGPRRPSTCPSGPSTRRSSAPVQAPRPRLHGRDLEQPRRDRRRDDVVRQEGITVYAANLHGETDNCKGHHATDMTLFKSRVKTEQGFDRQFLSNIELLYAISPETYRMGYIYDNLVGPLRRQGLGLPEAPGSSRPRATAAPSEPRPPPRVSTASS